MIALIGSGIEIGQPPDFLAVAQAMGNRIVVAVRNEVGILAVVPDKRRRVGMFVLETGVAFALDFPDIFAGGRVDRHDPVTAGVKKGHVQTRAFKYRRDMEAMLDLVLTIALLGVEPPDFLAVEIKAGEISRGHGRIDMLAVGARRSRRGIALAAHEHALAGAELALPEF